MVLLLCLILLWSLYNFVFFHSMLCVYFVIFIKFSLRHSYTQTFLVHFHSITLYRQSFVPHIYVKYIKLNKTLFAKQTLYIIWLKFKPTLNSLIGASNSLLYGVKICKIYILFKLKLLNTNMTSIPCLVQNG